jgi:hypothetical protein
MDGKRHLPVISPEPSEPASILGPFQELALCIASIFVLFLPLAGFGIRASQALRTVLATGHDHMLSPGHSILLALPLILAFALASLLGAFAVKRVFLGQGRLLPSLAGGVVATIVSALAAAQGSVDSMVLGAVVMALLLPVAAIFTTLGGYLGLRSRGGTGGEPQGVSGNMRANSSCQR